MPCGRDASSRGVITQLGAHALDAVGAGLPFRRGCATVHFSGVADCDHDVNMSSPAASGNAVNLDRAELDVSWQLQRVRGQLLHRETKTEASDPRSRCPTPIDTTFASAMIGDAVPANTQNVGSYATLAVLHLSQPRRPNCRNGRALTRRRVGGCAALAH
jgi:hypothetical protein